MSKTSAEGQGAGEQGVGRREQGGREGAGV